MDAGARPVTSNSVYVNFTEWISHTSISLHASQRDADCRLWTKMVYN